MSFKTGRKVSMLQTPAIVPTNKFQERSGSQEKPGCVWQGGERPQDIILFIPSLQKKSKYQNKTHICLCVQGQAVRFRNVLSHLLDIERGKVIRERLLLGQERTAAQQRPLSQPMYEGTGNTRFPVFHCFLDTQGRHQAAGPMLIYWVLQKQYRN